MLNKNFLRRPFKVCLQDLVDNSEGLGGTLQVSQLGVDLGQIKVALLVSGSLIGPANDLNDIHRVNTVLDGSASGRAVLRINRVDVQRDVDVRLFAIDSRIALRNDFDDGLDGVLPDIISCEPEHAFLIEGLQNLLFGLIDRSEAHVDEVTRVQFGRLTDSLVASQAKDVVNRHAMAVARAGSLGRVDVGVGVDPNQNSFGVNLEGRTDRAVADGVIAANREHNGFFLVNNRLVDVLRYELAALDRVLELLVGPHVDVLHVVGVVLHDLVQSGSVAVLRATMRLALVAADCGEHE